MAYQLSPKSGPTGEESLIITERMTFGSVIDPSETALRKKLEIFGSNNLESLYFYGPHKGMLDTPVESLPVTTLDAALKKRQLDHFARVDLSSPRRPAYFDGQITKLPAELGSFDLTLAIAVNGTIRSTTRPIVNDQQVTFVTRIPPHGLIDGRNVITVYAIVEDEDGRPVSLVRLAPE